MEAKKSLPWANVLCSEQEVMAGMEILVFFLEDGDLGALCPSLQAKYHEKSCHPQVEKWTLLEVSLTCRRLEWARVTVTECR